MTSWINGTPGWSLSLLPMIFCALLSGCVSDGVHSQALAELEQARSANESARKAHDGLMTKYNVTAEELARAKQQIEELGHARQLMEQLTSDLATAKQETTRTRQEHDAEVRKLQDKLREVETALESMRQVEQALRAQLQVEHSDKEREIQRLTQTQAALSKSLQDEIAKGEVRIRQVADRLTINMVDRVLFDSGQGHVKPAGLTVLKQVSDILKQVTDKQIRIEGHTDNVRIGGRLKDRFPTNWELSTTRATSVVRYLVDQGGIDPANLSAVGYADMRPIASNDTEEGRAANRRIEIVLYPKDLKHIVEAPQPASSLTSAPAH
jgi:chemotaxis protein MotB